MPRPVKATPAEIQEYAQQDPRPLYPLSHWVQVDGVRCAVEYLGADWGSGDPKYEIIMPQGFHAKYEDLHTLLCFDLADVKERASCVTLAPCTDDCHP